MSIKERIGDFFKPREVKEAEKLKELINATEQEEHFTALYLEGKISLEDYNDVLDSLRPITQINLRKLATGPRR